MLTEPSPVRSGAPPRSPRDMTLATELLHSASPVRFTFVFIPRAFTRLKLSITLPAQPSSPRLTFSLVLLFLSSPTHRISLDLPNEEERLDFSRSVGACGGRSLREYSLF